MEPKINNNPVSQTPSIIPPPSKWSKNILFTVMGLIVVGGSVFAGIQIGKNQTSNQQPIVAQLTASPTQTAVSPAQPTANFTTDSTTDWETYTGKYFTIKYPHSLNATQWSLEQANDESHSNINEGLRSIMGVEPPTILDYSKLSSDDIDTDILFFENNENYSITQWYSMYVFYPDNFGVPVEEEPFKKTIYIGGNIAGMGNADGMFYNEGILVPYTNKMVLIHTTYMDGSENYKQLVNQILSTFQFTN